MKFKLGSLRKDLTTVTKPMERVYGRGVKRKKGRKQ